MSKYDPHFGQYQPPSRAKRVAEKLRTWGHAISVIPFGGILGTVMTASAALVDSMDGFINQSFGSGVKSAVSGTVDSVATLVQSEWWLKPVSWITGLATGSTVAELIRQGSEGVLNAAFPGSKQPTAETMMARQMQVLGPQPMTAGHVPASIAYVPGVERQQQMAATGQISPNGQAVPANHWTDSVAQSRGQDPEAARQAWAKGNHEEMTALRAANEQRAELGA